jgi:hypothetical protein
VGWPSAAMDWVVVALVVYMLGLVLIILRGRRP